MDVFIGEVIDGMSQFLEGVAGLAAVWVGMTSARLVLRAERWLQESPASLPPQGRPPRPNDL